MRRYRKVEYLSTSMFEGRTNIRSIRIVRKYFPISRRVYVPRRLCFSAFRSIKMEICCHHSNEIFGIQVQSRNIVYRHRICPLLRLYFQLTMLLTILFRPMNGRTRFFFLHVSVSFAQFSRSRVF